MHIPLTPTPPALQFSEYVVDLPPRGSIEVVALRQKVSDDDRINTVAVQEDNDGKSLWIGHVRLSEHHLLDRAGHLSDRPTRSCKRMRYSLLIGDALLESGRDDTQRHEQ